MKKLKQDKNNFRIHSETNKDMIRRSLEECGAGRSILIDNDDSAIAGNGVLEQAEKLGIPIKVIESDGSALIAIKRTDLAPDDPKRKKLALADNACSDASAFDHDKLIKEFSLEELAGDWEISPDAFCETREVAERNIETREIVAFERVYSLLTCDIKDAAKMAELLTFIEKKFPEIHVTTDGGTK